MSQVAIKKCSDYEPQNVQRAVEEAVSLLGGIEKFVKPAQKVLIKPNLLSARPPEDGVCTHPEVVRAVIRLAKQQTSNIYVGDSPGGFEVKASDIIYEASGMTKVCQEEAVNLVKFDSVETIDGLPIAKVVKEVDVIINVPKMKTHNLAGLTGAVKNMFGAVVGKYKAEMHFKYPKVEDFCEFIVDVFSHVKPQLSIMDGIVGMDGNGPAAGRLRNLGLVLASPDAVALDAVFAEIAGLKPLDVLTTRLADARSLGTGRIPDIEILGERLEEARIRDFIVPEGSLIYKMPDWVIKFFGTLIRSYPVINKVICEDCRICEKNCPAGVITIDKHYIDHSKCIFCFCCTELCPHNAMEVKKTFMVGILFLMKIKIVRSM